MKNKFYISLLMYDVVLSLSRLLLEKVQGEIFVVFSSVKEGNKLKRCYYLSNLYSMHEARMWFLHFIYIRNIYILDEVKYEIRSFKNGSFPGVQ